MCGKIRISVSSRLSRVLATGEILSRVLAVTGIIQTPQDTMGASQCFFLQKFSYIFQKCTKFLGVELKILQVFWRKIQVWE